MKRRLATLAAAASIFGAAPALAPVVDGSPVNPAPAVAKSCSSGYKHAALSWGHKCLRVNQYCKRSGDGEYHKYGFHCHKRDAQGRYRLSR